MERTQRPSKGVVALLAAVIVITAWAAWPWLSGVFL